MDIKVSNSGTTSIITMSGRFDFGAHRVFKDAYAPMLVDKGVKTIDLQLAEVTYMDSSALGMLLLLHERAQAVGREVILSRATTTVSQILDIANFDKLFVIR